jgi:two-component system chemotaxis response regulator CheY
MGYNILVVDDSRVVRAMVIRTLKMAEMDLGDVHEAANGREALDLLGREWVDLVLADINMPVMSGVQMIEEMSRSGLMSSVPVVIISTERSATRIEELKTKGIRAYLRKPFTPESIRSVVEQVLAGRVSRAAPGAG